MTAAPKMKPTRSGVGLGKTSEILPDYDLTSPIFPEALVNSASPNAWLVKNSRYMKREDRDPRFFRSPEHDDWLFRRSEADLFARMDAEYVLAPVYDRLADESPKIRDLTTSLIWREDELREKIAILAKACRDAGRSIEEAEFAVESEVRSLFERCQALPNEIKDIRDQIAHARSHKGSVTNKKLISMTHAELIEKKIPPREFILFPWIPECSVTMLFAPPGIGKTNLGLSIAFAVATGGNFLHWKVPKARKVVYLDAEMHEADLQARAKNTEAGFNFVFPEPDFLRYINGTWQANDVGIPDLSTPEGQKIVDEQIADADFLVIDNLSTVCRTGNENEAAAWAKMQHWLLSLRHRGVATLLVHHSGKSKDESGIPIQRGSSMREVIMEAILCLKRPKGYTADRGCVFEVHFLKARGFFGADAEPFEASLQQKGDAQVWTYRRLEIRNYDRVVDLFIDGITATKDIAEELGITRQAVEKHLKRAKKDGDIR